MNHIKWNKLSVMRNLIMLACILQALFVDAQEKNIDKLPIITIKNETINYAGVINKKGASLVLEFINTNLYKELHIISGGGEILSAMEIGSAIFEKKMNVTVSHLCNSSCANYIFPAGVNKKINAGAFVLWHGDARQKNFRKELQDLENLFEEKDLLAMNESEIKRLVMRRKTIKMQDDFYKLIGINGSIARIGQEIENLDKRAWLWALPVSTMNVFGINNIEAPSDYGTSDYCDTNSKKYYPKNKPICLDLSLDDINSWKNRID